MGRTTRLDDGMLEYYLYIGSVWSVMCKTRRGDEAYTTCYSVLCKYGKCDIAPIG